MSASKNEISLSEIELIFETWRWILFDANISKTNLEIMYSRRKEQEIKILRRGFFQHYRQLAKFTIVIQLCKFFSHKHHTQKVSFSKLKNKLSNCKYSTDLRQKLLENAQLEKGRLFTSKKEIQETLELLQEKIESKRDIITRMEIWRDEYYAHTDVASTLPKLEVDELYDLMKLATEVYNSIRGNIMDVEFMFDMNAEWSITSTMNILVSEEEKFKGRLEELGGKQIN